jgi:uncharacterized protein (TIGR02246 family)
MCSGRALLSVVLLVVTATASFSRKKASVADDETAIRKADAEWSQAANINQLDRFLSFYADDASVLPFNAPMVSGKDQIRQFFTQLMSKPGFAVSFAPTKIEVSKSRDVAYEIGTAELKLNDAQGQPTTMPAKYVVVWSKDSNRHWKAVADVFNTNK